MAAIPRIVLDDRAVDGSDPVSCSSTSSSTTNGPVLAAAGSGSSGRPLSEVDLIPEGPHDYVPHRCNSDIGLPTTSMPNLSLAMGLGAEHGDGVDKLGVYCSPRTTRRSVDLEVGSSSRDPAARAEYEWLEDKSSSLQVLSSGSRVGSAISLNSVCTAHSVGLLSNDSSDEYQDSFLQDVSLVGFPAPHGDRSSHFRRLQSTPEAEAKSGSEAGVTPRTSYSLCNLNAAQAPPPAADRDPGPNRGGQLTPEQLCLLPSDLDECKDNAVLPPGEGARRKREEEEGEKSKVAHMEVCEDHPKAPMVSYGKGSITMREGRIRRWLQDMDKAAE